MAVVLRALLAADARDPAATGASAATGSAVCAPRSKTCEAGSTTATSTAQAPRSDVLHQLGLQQQG